MKTTLTQSQVENQLCEITQAYERMVKAKVNQMTASIDNIGMVDLINIYEDLPYDQRGLILPGEAENESLIVTWRIAQGCVIILHSEPCVKLQAKLETFKLN